MTGPAGDRPELRGRTRQAIRDRLVEGVGDVDLRSYERSPVAVLHLVVGLIALAVLVGLTELLPHTHEGLERDLDGLTGTWGGGLAQLCDAVAATAGIAVVVVALGAAHLAERSRHMVTIVVAAGTTVAAVVIASRTGGSTPSRMVGEEWALAAAVAGIAVVSASFSVLSVMVSRLAWIVISVGVLVGGLGADVSIGSRAVALVGATCIGSLVALVAGTPSHPLSRAELCDGLNRARLPVDRIEPHPGDARGSMPWVATLSTGRAVFVKVEVRDHRTADLLFRTWRRVRLRGVDDERPGSSMRRATEHEAYVATRAGAAGVRTPAVIGTGTLPDDRGAFAVFEAIAAPTMGEVGPTLSDATLRSAWSQVQVMHRAGIAHRDLRAANLLVDDAGDPWVIDFGFAELSAGERSLAGDVVELLASTAPLVGVDRAVDAALTVLGPHELEEALPWIQPLAVSSASRAALGRAGFTELADRVRERLGVARPEVPQLARIRPKTVLTMVALGVAVWTLLPQVTANVDWGRVLHADPAWFGLALGASIATYVGAAVSLRGSVPVAIPFGGTLEAQLASSFTNRITPAKVGGMAVNLRYLVKQGIDTPSAATGIAVSTTAGTVVHVALSVVALIWAGDVGGARIEAPSARTLAVTGGIVVAVLGATMVIRPLRAWMLQTTLPSLRRSWSSFVEVLRDPRNLLRLSTGSIVVTLGNIVALVAALAAFGEHPPVATVAVVYLAGSAIASAAPTPGGLGATEAALVAGLSLTGIPERVAVPAVLLFRLATFWLPILPGWIAFVHLQRRGDL